MNKKKALITIMIAFMLSFTLAPTFFLDEEAIASATAPYIQWGSDIISIGNDKMELQFTVNNASKKFYLSGILDKTDNYNFINQSAYLDFKFKFNKSWGAPETFNIEYGDANDSQVIFSGYDVLVQNSTDLSVDFKYTNESRNITFHKKITFRQGENFVAQQIGIENNNASTLSLNMTAGVISRFQSFPMKKAGLQMRYIGMNFNTVGGISQYFSDSAVLGNTTTYDQVAMTCGYENFTRGVTLITPHFTECDQHGGHQNGEMVTSDSRTYEELSINFYFDIFNNTDPVNHSTDYVMWFPPQHFGIWNNASGYWWNTMYDFINQRHVLTPPSYEGHGDNRFNEGRRPCTDQVITEDMAQLENTGIKIYIMTDGWQNTALHECGTWRNYTGNNITRNAAYIRSHNMTPGWWYMVMNVYNTGYEEYNPTYLVDDSGYGGGLWVMDWGDDTWFPVWQNITVRMKDEYKIGAMVKFDGGDVRWEDSDPYAYNWSYATPWRDWRNYYRWYDWMRTNWSYDDPENITYIQGDGTGGGNCFDLNFVCDYGYMSYFWCNAIANDIPGNAPRQDEVFIKDMKNIVGKIPLNLFGPTFWVDLADYQSQTACSIMGAPLYWCSGMASGTWNQTEKDHLKWLLDIYYNVSASGSLPSLTSSANPRNEDNFTTGSDFINMTISNIWNPSNHANIQVDYGDNTGYVQDYSDPNTAPVISNESPTNSSVIPSGGAWLSVDLEDLEGDSIEVNITCSNGDWGWSDTGNRTESMYASPLSEGTTYTWWVNATDGILWSRAVYEFTTNNIPDQTTPYPADGAFNITAPPTSLNITVSDADLDPIYIQFRTNASGSWVTLRQLGGVGDGSYSTTNTSLFSANNTIYYWSVNITDNVNWNNVTYSFRTQNSTNITINNQVNITTPLPSNGSIGIDLNYPQVSVSITDLEGDHFNWSIEVSNGNHSSTTGATNGTKTCALHGLLPSTTYTWWVNATDLVNGTTVRKEYSFTTKDNAAPIISNEDPENTSESVSYARTRLYADIIDPDGDAMTYTIETDPYIGTASGTDFNGTITSIIGGMLPNVTYTWYVNVTDGYDTTRAVFNYTTIYTYTNQIMIVYSTMDMRILTMITVAIILLLFVAMASVVALIVRKKWYGGSKE